jgi:hypothetical protein
MTQVVLMRNTATGNFDVHKFGCADSRNYGRYGGMFGDLNDANHPITATTRKDVVEATYGPEAGSFYWESWDENSPELHPEHEDKWTEYVGEFNFVACSGL